MPFDIQPLTPSRGGGGGVGSYSPDWGWLGQQSFSRDAAWDQIGNYRSGSVGGGPTAGQYDLLDDPRKYAIFATPPPITDQAQTQQKAFGRFGSVTLDMIDPFMTAESVMQGLGVDAGGSNDT